MHSNRVRIFRVGVSPSCCTGVSAFKIGDNVMRSFAIAPVGTLCPSMFPPQCSSILIAAVLPRAAVKWCVPRAPLPFDQVPVLKWCVPGWFEMVCPPVVVPRWWCVQDSFTVRENFCSVQLLVTEIANFCGLNATAWRWLRPSRVYFPVFSGLVGRLFSQGLARQNTSGPVYRAGVGRVVRS